MFEAPKCPPPPRKLPSKREPSKRFSKNISPRLQYDKNGIPLPPKNACVLPPVPDHEEMLFESRMQVEVKKQQTIEAEKLMTDSVL